MQEKENEMQCNESKNVNCKQNNHTNFPVIANSKNKSVKRKKKQNSSINKKIKETIIESIENDTTKPE